MRRGRAIKRKKHLSKLLVQHYHQQNIIKVVTNTQCYEGSIFDIDTDGSIKLLTQKSKTIFIPIGDIKRIE